MKWPICILLLAAAWPFTAAHAEVKELKADQARQSVELDYAEASAAIAAVSPDCEGPAIALAIECVGVIMDGPQGGAAAEDNQTFANVPVTPVLKHDDASDKMQIFVELTAETGGISHIDAFDPDVQAKLRRDLFRAKDLLSKVKYVLSDDEQTKLLIDQKPIEFRVSDGWDRLTLLEPVQTKITVNPPSLSIETALGAAEDWLP